MNTKATNPKEDLQAIREIMERSSKFLSLSGLSGVFAGICALVGSVVVWYFILQPHQVNYYYFIQNPGAFSTLHTGFQFVIIATMVLLFALFGTFYFSFRKAKKTGEIFWTSSTRRLLFHLMLPLATGGIVIILLILKNKIDLIVPLMLIFYGLALVNAGKFTLSEIHYLGLTEIVLGILSVVFPEYSLLLWIIGFGIMHIVYGTVMFYRYERQK